MVYVEQIVGIITSLCFDKTVIVPAIIVAHPPAVVIVHEIDIAPWF